MLGSNSLVREGDELRELPLPEGDPEILYQDYLPDEVVHRPGHEGWMVVVDGCGRVRNGFKESPDRPGWHMLHWVSSTVPPEYLAFLRRERIPYLIAGNGRVDLAVALGKMKEKLGVETLVTTAGGALGGAFLRAGLVDEVNIIFNPQLYGGTETPALFDSPDLQPDEWPTKLRLLSAKVYTAGGLWLRYEVERTETSS